MLDSIDHLIIAVEDLDLAEQLSKVLGTKPVWRGFMKNTVPQTAFLTLIILT